MNKQLEYFRKVAETESFTKAAEQLFISQPALSRSIKFLENELGVPLFERKGRILKLNHYGEIFLEKVEESISALEEGKTLLKELVDPFTGTIRISFIHTLGNNLVPELISKFQKIYKHVNFQLYQGDAGAVIDHIESGKVDFGILMEANFSEDIIYETVKNEELFVIVPKNHPLASKKSLPLNLIKDEPFIGFKEGIGLRAVADKLCLKAGFSPNIAFEGQQVGTINGFVSAGLGVSLVPKNRGISEFDIQCIPVSNPVCFRNINLAWKEDIFIPKVVNEFKNFIYKHIATIQI